MSDRELTGRCFFLDPTAGEGAPRLIAEDEEHLRRVLRAAPGDRVTGLDGRGARVELLVRAVGRRELVLERVGEPAREPAPGDPRAPLDWIVIAAPLPRGDRAGEMLDRLVQLGVAELVPLEAERSQGGREGLGAARRARLERIARAACKQSRRAWVLELGQELGFEEWLRRGERRALWLADPAATTTLADALARLPREPRGTRERPLAIALGPEGGWTAAERAAAQRSGALEVALGPHVLRTETAAESAAAIVAQLRWWRAP